MCGCGAQAKRATMIQKGEREADFWDNPIVEKDEMEEHELQAYIEAGGTPTHRYQLCSLLHACPLGSGLDQSCGQSLSRSLFY